MFWIPTGSSTDVLSKLWNLWYGGLVFSGQADLTYTELMFFPNGVSLTYHTYNLPYMLISKVLRLFMPASNAFNFVYLLLILGTATSAYIYGRYIFRDKWIALFAAIIFSIRPLVAWTPNYLDLGFVALIPLALYCFHRGINDRRSHWIVASGVLTGLTTVVFLYIYVCLLISLGLYVCALAWTRWQQKKFWLQIGLLALTVLITSSWRIYPMVQNAQGLGASLTWAGISGSTTDLISFFVNYDGVFSGRLFSALFQMPIPIYTNTHAYLGYLPLLLVGIGLANNDTRRKMLPWLVLCLIFMTLALGSFLTIYGKAFTNILLPKHYLDHLVPVVFRAFYISQHFQIGVLLPLAVLSSFGAVAAARKFQVTKRPLLILMLVAIAAIEFYMPVRDGSIPATRIAFLDWLSAEDNDEIVLVNVPMGRTNSKFYNLHQSFNGYPHAEGAISRTPDEAYDYIRSNRVLSAWHQNEAVSCETMAQDNYLAELERMESDGFSHIVYHRRFLKADDIANSFQTAQASYSDDYVSIYRLDDLRASCPRPFGS